MNKMNSSPPSFQPNEDFLATIVAMGIEENVAKEALFCTGNRSVDDAVNYIFNSSAENGPLRQNCSTEHIDSDESCEEEEDDIPFCKMVFVINMGLKMGVGKVAAQVGHACLGLYRKLLELDFEEDLNCWEEMGEKKIVLKGHDAAHLLELQEKATEAKVPCYLVRDAGHTQIEAGSITVLSLFGLEEKVDKITGKLSLL